MIPAFEEFLYPFLYYLKKGKLSVKDLRAKLIKHFDLSDNDIMLKTRSGNTTQLSDRMGWARQYFRRAKFIDIPNRGVYQLTERGKQYLNNHKTLTIADLLQYPEFAEYSNRTIPEKNCCNNHKSNTPNLFDLFDNTQTPTEILENAYNTIYKSLTDELLSMVIKQTPEFFEKLVVDLLVAMGYGGADKQSAMVTPYSHDDGIDGIIKEDKLGLDNIYLQAKRWTSPVSKPQIQQFSGALDEQNATKGVFITTSTFSKEAEKFVAKSSKKIVLINGQKLAEYMIEFNVGVSLKKAYFIKRIDTDYFDDLD